MHVDDRNSPYARLRTLELGVTTLQPGFWHQKQRINREVSLQEGYRRLLEHGNMDNLRLAVGEMEGEFRGPQFMDSDIYKWLEAAAYECSRNRDENLQQSVNECIALLEKVQLPDGYLNSYWQFVKPGQRWTDLEAGHELYCAGHLIEAAVALHRGTGTDRLLTIAKRVADNIVDTFGEEKLEKTGGHPEIELALVELYRETGDGRYLDMALLFVNRRGKGMMGNSRVHFGAAYFQDRVPVREAEEVEGHAVRQLYLASGVTDIFMETGESALLRAMQRLWRNMTGRKMHITGGFGARHEGESFGDDFELPSDRCYCETCATIAAIMWSWRMLLATGEPAYADLMERCLYNGFLSGVSLDGSHYFYVNPLQSRGGIERVGWFDCACCPPNVMRLIAMVDNYIATVDDEGLYVHHYMPANVDAVYVNRQKVSLGIETGYPWDEKITITVSVEKPGVWSLFLRIPAWCEKASLKVNGESIDVEGKSGEYVKIHRTWNNDDRIELLLPMEPAVVEPDPTIDAIRGSLSFTCGPFVYCIEEIDNPGADLDDIRISPDVKITSVWKADVAGGIKILNMPGRILVHDKENTGLYHRVEERVPELVNTNLTAVPYFLWANRGPGKMRVWIPRL